MGQPAVREVDTLYCCTTLNERRAQLSVGCDGCLLLVAGRGAGLLGESSASTNTHVGWARSDFSMKERPLTCGCCVGGGDCRSASDWPSQASCGGSR